MEPFSLADTKRALLPALASDRYSSSYTSNSSFYYLLKYWSNFHRSYFSFLPHTSPFLQPKTIIARKTLAASDLLAQAEANGNKKGKRKEQDKV